MLEVHRPISFRQNYSKLKERTKAELRQRRVQAGTDTVQIQGYSNIAHKQAQIHGGGGRVVEDVCGVVRVSLE